MGLGFMIQTLVLTATVQPVFQYGARWFQEPATGEFSFYLRFVALGVPTTALLAIGFWQFPGGLEKLKRLSSLRILLPLLASTAVGATTFWVLQSSVVTDDEYVYLFQAALLALGKASYPAPPLGEFFVNVFVIMHDGRWLGQYPPGHPLLLAPFAMVGIPRLLPIVLAGLNAAISFAVLRHVFGSTWAWLGTALLLLSPLFIFTGSTLLSHSTAYLALALGMLFFFRWSKEPRASSSLGGGLALGFLFATRPYTGLILGGLVGLYWALCVIKQKRLVDLVTLVLGGGLFVLFFLFYNQQATGDAFTTGYQAIRGAGQVELGFGPVAPGIEHTFAQGLSNVALLCVRFLVWGLSPVLMLFSPLLTLAAVLSRQSRVPEVRLSAILLVGGMLSYIAYWSLGVMDTGPVKTYELLLPGMILALAGLRFARDRFGSRIVLAASLASCLVATAVLFPFQTRHLRALTDVIQAPHREVAKTVEPPAIVFVEGMQRPPYNSWVFGRPNPSPDLQDPILFVRDAGAQNQVFLEAHPGRRGYRLSLTGNQPVVLPLQNRRR